MVDAPSKEEFEAWTTHPVTEWFLSEIKKSTEDLQDNLAVGGAMRDTAEATAMTYARQVGVTEGLVRALTIEPPIKEAMS